MWPSDPKGVDFSQWKPQTRFLRFAFIPQETMVRPPLEETKTPAGRHATQTSAGGRLSSSRMSLRNRLDMAVSLVLLLTVGSMLYVSTLRQSQQFIQEQQGFVQGMAAATAQAIRAPLISGDYEQVDATMRSLFGRAGLSALQLTDGKNRSIVNLGPGLATDPQAPAWFQRWFDVEPPRATASVEAGGKSYGRLMAIGDTRQLYLSLWQVTARTSLVALAAYVVLNLTVMLVLQLGFRPLDRLQEAAEKLARGVREPLNEDVAAELRVPVRAFNRMSEQISRLIGELREKHNDLQIAAQAIESLSEGVVILKQDLGVKYFNPFALRLAEQIPGLTDTLVDILDRHLAHSVDATLQLAADMEGTAGRRALDILISSAVLAEGEAIYYVIVVRDITEEREQKAKLAREASRDALTGTLNRPGFVRRLNEHISAQQPGMLLFIDLDHFKRINESYGHTVGDQFLKHLASALADRIGAGNLLARFGGDEFLVLLRSHNLESGTFFAERLVHDFPSFKLLHQGELLHVTASIGGIYFDADNPLSGEMLISHADATLFQAKKEGRNRFAIFAHAMPEMARIRVDQEWMGRLTTALEENRIVPMFQPIMDLAEEQISHYEALARLDWDGKLLRASEFIPHAERLGLVGEVDVAMFRSVLETLSRRADLVLATNLSGYSLNNRHVQKRLFECLDEFGVCAPRLIIEITESTAIEELADAKSFMKRARERGCRFAIDDFGVGYSSLQMLSQLDLDYLKIDGSLLKALHSENTALLKAVQGLADALHIPTVAEHLDTEEKLIVVKRLGINYAQGYLIGEPAPFEDIRPR